jgi:hypothetical protein
MSDPTDTPNPPKPRRRRKQKTKTLPPFQNGAPVAGRPRVYEQAYCPRAKRLALLGLTDIEIAEQFGISPETLYEWARAQPDFSESLRQGKIEADSFVADSMYRRATGTATFPAVKIFAPQIPGGEPIYAGYIERALPDVNAGFRWLYNRQPDRWRERKQVDVAGTLEFRVSQMTPEERRARLIELQAKAALIIDGEARDVTEGEE